MPGRLPGRACSGNVRVNYPMPDLPADRILVRGVNWIGDAVMTIPAIGAIRRAFPSSEITLLVNDRVAPLFACDPRIDRVMVYEAHHRTARGKLHLIGSLKKENFLRAILLQNAFDAALIAYLAGIPERIGYRRDGRGALLTMPVSYSRQDRRMHHVRYYLTLLDAAGIRAEYEHPWIFLTVEERLAARHRLSPMKRPVLGINPGATFGSAKRWLPLRFAEAAIRFIRDSGGSVVLFGGPTEKGIAAEIAEHIKTWSSLPADAHSGDTPSSSRLMNVAGATSVRELIALISECDVLLSNDSGPLHLAYAVGTPVAALFGSTDPALTGPLGDGNAVISGRAQCSPCFARECPHDNLLCMDQITVDEVCRGIQKILPRRKAVFLDRDGTLCRDAGYLNSWNDFELLPGVEALGQLRGRGFSLIGVSNQSGIHRGIVEESFVKEVSNFFITRHGFDDFYQCPHTPGEHCPCRKPEPAMVLAAKTRHGIDTRRSYVIGDKKADMALARAVGACGILVTTGHDRESPDADYVVRDLHQAVEVILEREAHAP